LKVVFSLLKPDILLTCLVVPLLVNKP